MKRRVNLILILSILGVTFSACESIKTYISYLNHKMTYKHRLGKILYAQNLYTTDSLNDSCCLKVYTPLVYEHHKFYPYTSYPYDGTRYPCFLGLVRVDGSKWYRVVPKNHIRYLVGEINSVDWLKKESLWIDFDASVGSKMKYAQDEYSDTFITSTITSKVYKIDGTIEITLTDTLGEVTTSSNKNILLPCINLKTYSNKSFLVQSKSYIRRTNANGDTIIRIKNYRSKKFETLPF